MSLVLSTYLSEFGIGKTLLFLPQIQQINKGKLKIFLFFSCLGVQLQVLFRVLVCLVFFLGFCFNP